MKIVDDDKNNGFTSIEPGEEQKAAYWGKNTNKGDYWGDEADRDGVSDLKDRQGNGVADFNDLPQQAGANDEQQKSYMSDPEELIRQIYTPAPKPQFDTEAANYKQWAAKMNALGQGLSGVADIISLARGGQVNAPVQNNKVPAYINSYWNQRQDYLSKLDDWQARDAANKSMASRIALNQLNRDRAFEAEKQWRFIDDQRQERVATANLRNMQIDNTRQQLSLEERQRHNRELEKYYGRTSSVEKPMRIKTSDGQIHELNKESAGYLRSEALSRVDALAKAYPYLFEEYNLSDYDYDTGNFKKGYRIAKHTTDEDLIRAYLELNNRINETNSSNKMTGGYY
ncbi:hypothetical protein [Draconibacterium orientale]|uniref:hypothetical protein n=1 Tax=Draconibacterium orientale TaxID=1168034 RepID=UPI002ABDE716|nr:hypothetical protein [Draconibacterium orientale]